MKTKKKKKNGRRRSSVPCAKQSSECKALARVDSARIKRRAMTDCRRARATFDKAEAELAVFEKKDKPAFVRWYHMELGPLIEEAKRQSSQLREWQNRMERLSRFASMKRCGIREATRMYERSAEEFEAIERKLEERAAQEEELRRQRDERHRDLAMKELRQLLRSFLRHQAKRIKGYLRQGATKSALLYDLVGFFSDQEDIDPVLCIAALQDDEGDKILKEVGLEGALDQDAAALGDDEIPPEFKSIFAEIFDFPVDDPEVATWLGRVSAAPPADDARLTALRRELAFALHPDQSDSASDPAKLELWYQVQEAVEARDLDRLEVLHAHMQVLTGELIPSTPVSRLMALTRMYRNSRDALRRRIRELRKTIEWGFDAADDARRAGLKRRCAAHLEEEIAALCHRLEDAKAIYEMDFKPRARQDHRRSNPTDPSSKRSQSMFDGFE